MTRRMLKIVTLFSSCKFPPFPGVLSLKRHSSFCQFLLSLIMQLAFITNIFIESHIDFHLSLSGRKGRLFYSRFASIFLFLLRVTFLVGHWEEVGELLEVMVCLIRVSFEAVVFVYIDLCG